MLAEAAQAERRRPPFDVMLRSLPAAASVLVGVVLMAAALLKSADPRDTLAALAFAFGEGAARPLLYALVAAEIVLASALIAVIKPRLTLALATALFASFLGWIGYLELTDAPVGCGCGLPNNHWLLGDGRGAAAIRAGGLLLLSACGLTSFLVHSTHKEIVNNEDHAP